MATIPWYLAALGAAVVWGIHYPLIAHALKHVSVPTVLLLSVLPALVVGPFFYRPITADLQAMAGLGWSARALIMAVSLTSLAGTVFMYLAIGGKNATLAAMIEISYPVFVALFSWLLFREMQINASVLAGALLVFAGVAIIIFGNR
ncbi:MAG: EamA family transporter [Gammaproteobacteria bacterium]